MVLMTSRNGVRSGTVNSGKSRSRASSSRIAGDGLEHHLETEAEGGRSRCVELGDQPALRARAAPQPRPGGQHDPLRLEPGRRALDLDRMRAGHAPLQRVRPAGHELQPQLLVAEEVREPELVAHLGRMPKLPHAVRGDADGRHGRRAPVSRHDLDCAVASVRRHGRRRATTACVITRAEGVWVWDDAGPPLPRRDRRAVVRQPRPRPARDRRGGRTASCARSTPTASSATTRTSPALELAERLAALAPAPGSRVFLGSGGGDAIDTAAKIARAYHAQHGAARPRAPDRPRRTATTARTASARASAGSRPTRPASGTLVADVSTCPHDDADALERGDPAHRRRARRGVLLRAGDRRRRRAAAAATATSRPSPTSARATACCSSPTA